MGFWGFLREFRDPPPLPQELQNPQFPEFGGFGANLSQFQHPGVHSKGSGRHFETISEVIFGRVWVFLREFFGILGSPVGISGSPPSTHVFLDPQFLEFDEFGAPALQVKAPPRAVGLALPARAQQQRGESGALDLGGKTPQKLRESPKKPT